MTPLPVFIKQLDCLQQHPCLQLTLCQRAITVKSLTALSQGRLSPCYYTSAAERYSREMVMRGCLNSGRCFFPQINFLGGLQ